MIKNPFSTSELKLIKKNLRYLRLRYYKDLTYREFGSKIGLSYSRISDLEAGAMPSLNDLFKYQKLFNVSYDFLLGKTSNTRNPNNENLGLSDESIENLEKLKFDKDIDASTTSYGDFFWTDSDSINLILENMDLLKALSNYISHLIIDNDDEIDYSQELIKMSGYNIIDLKNVITEIKAREIITKLNNLRNLLKIAKENKK